MLNFILIVVFLVIPILFYTILILWMWRNWQNNKNMTDRELINQIDY